MTSRGPNAIPNPEYLRVSGNLFYDKMVHFFDLARWFTGEDIVRVSALGAVIADPVFAEFNDVDTALVTLQTRSGALVLIDNARRAAYGYDDRIELFGTGGLLESSRVTEGNIMRVFDDKLMLEGFPRIR
jgi:myo-inositol 2-dehydrogenase/D-chiro-inositol 1-dehydrogenase